MDSNIIVMLFIFLIFVIILIEMNKRERFMENKKKTFVSLILNNNKLNTEISEGSYELTINGMPVHEFFKYLETHTDKVESFANNNGNKNLKINLNIDEKSDVFKQIKSKFLDIQNNKKEIVVSDCPIYVPKSFVSNMCPGCK